MTVNELLIPPGHPNRPGVNLTELRAIVFHYTGNDAPGATDIMNAKYFARKYVRVGPDYFEENGKTPFAYGSAQVVADSDSITIAIPVTEAAWAVGDRRILPWTEQWRGQQHVSRNLFNCKPNYQTLSIEICNNDIIKDSDSDWLASVEMAAEWVIEFLKSRSLKVDEAASLSPQLAKTIVPGSVVLLRHYDISGKLCPKPFIDNPGQWTDVVKKISMAV